MAYFAALTFDSSISAGVIGAGGGGEESTRTVCRETRLFELNNRPNIFGFNIRPIGKASKVVKTELLHFHSKPQLTTTVLPSMDNRSMAMQIPAIFSVFGSFSVILTYAIFPDLRRLRYVELVFYVAVNDLLAAIGSVDYCA